MRVKHYVVAAFCTVLAVGVIPGAAMAQDVSGPNLTAAFIYRFALFTEWPAGTLPQGGPITMCVVGDTAVRDALVRTVRGVTVHDRAVVVAFGQPDEPPPLCHTLYVSAVSAAQASRLVAGLREVPVLTISDLQGFNRMGGIAEYFWEAGSLRFSIELDAVTQARLQLSSRLLQLARPRP